MKAYFLSRAMREKLLLLLFVGLAAVLWLSSLTRRGKAFIGDWRGTIAELATQEMWLRQHQQIEKQAAAAVKNLDPARTLNANRLVGELNAIAARAGLAAPAVDSPRTERIDQFAVHSTQITFRNVDWDALVRFDTELTKRLPYISLEQCVLTANKTNYLQLSATFKVSSTEIAR